jgi:hypothetical protein
MDLPFRRSLFGSLQLHSKGLASPEIHVIQGLARLDRPLAYLFSAMNPEKATVIRPRDA